MAVFQPLICTKDSDKNPSTRLHVSFHSLPVCGRASQQTQSKGSDPRAEVVEALPEIHCTVLQFVPFSIHTDFTLP